MTENTKLEVADEIIAMKIANEIKKVKYPINSSIKRLMKEREEMYKGDNEIIEKIINIYGGELLRNKNGKRASKNK